MQQQQNMQSLQGTLNQQTFMERPPTIISTKDELYLKDMLSWNLLAMKKAHFYAAQCTDPEVKAELDKAGQMHQRHYQKILSHLQNPNQPTGQIQ
ncbi:ferritin family protein [Calidifontibacillus oryziterrae]|uniref:hypothetical protein n=1 Tax=Calidifontibacillus oryziterrae TaxID=1191699 RepID=UPI000302E139|nr:hypothetical protein [Calidifontibacillus oryziterrae]